MISLSLTYLSSVWFACISSLWRSMKIDGEVLSSVPSRLTDLLDISITIFWEVLAARIDNV